MPVDYNSTLNLPKTDFPMRAGLPQREPAALRKWEEEKIYEKLQQKNAGKPKFILHDGPPFSNGSMHIGHALNKLLKDFIIKYKSMTGYLAPYMPGWDNHGMPIESEIIKKNKLDRKEMSVADFRSACRDFARDFVNIQREGFKRLGVWGDWEHPYLTMDPSFEAEEVRVFGEMYRKGYIYKGKKPVYWCPFDETALAEAEIEYADDECVSIYVKFPLAEDFGKLRAMGAGEKTFFVIWTTTAWTLPANVAICVGPKFDYALIKAGDECYVTAAELAAPSMAAAGITDYEVLGKIKGAELEYMRARHPFLDRDSLVITGSHVTLDSGTGCVHTAPGHGADDYNVCRRYRELPVLVPVDEHGRMTAEAGRSAGLTTDAANAEITGELSEKGLLLASKKIIHQYPHCWRCEHPVLFRATSQWFCSVDAFRKQAVEAAEDIEFRPEWGKNRLEAMIGERSDWCISRQRHWGLPIPVFYCKKCGKPVCDERTAESVAQIFEKRGSNAWFELEPSRLLPEGYVCPHCGADEFETETDTLDGWFDSGSTHLAALALRDPTNWPADLYLEGPDQYRGWFQSSLLTAMAVKGRAPFKKIITHGWAVDGDGRAMHKSLGNGVSPDEVVNKWGADVLRLWVASSDYQNDVRISDGIVKQLSEAYRKIRNTARFIIGNLYDFDPGTDLCDKYTRLDRWALGRLADFVERSAKAYEECQFHIVYHALYDFCVVDMSNLYLDVIKDRLYVEKADGESRRAAQTVIYTVLDAITRVMAPILAFTSDEIWHSMPHRAGDDPVSPVFNSFPAAVAPAVGEEEKKSTEAALRLRERIKKALEEARDKKVIGASLEAQVCAGCSPEEYRTLAGSEDFLREICIVSELTLREGDGVEIRPAPGRKCVRCWTRSRTVGRDPEHPDLCARCAAIMKS